MKLFLLVKIELGDGKKFQSVLHLLNKVGCIKIKKVGQFYGKVGCIKYVPFRYKDGNIR